MKIAFSPSVYEHAAFLLGMFPWEVSRDAELLWSAHRTAYGIYHHSPVVVGIDIYNLEAEAYGCVVDRPDGNGIPAITRGILGSIAESRSLKPFDPKTDGRIGMAIEAGKRLADEFPEADVRIPVSGPFSIAVSLRGLTGLLEDVASSPAQVSDLLRQLVEGQVRLCETVVESGLDVAFFESAAAPPLLSPSHFREVELPAPASHRPVLARDALEAGGHLPPIDAGHRRAGLDVIGVKGGPHDVTVAHRGTPHSSKRV